MSTDIPGASVYGQAVALAKKRYESRLADLNKQRQQTMRQAGFLGDINPETGLITNMRTDPYNKYGHFQQLNRAQALRHDELLGQNLARGLSSRGGLGAQNLGNLRYDFGKEDAEFGANLTDMLGAFDRQQQDEKYAYDEALFRAQLEAAQSAIAAGDYGYPEGSDGSDPYDYLDDGGYPDGGSLFAYSGPPMPDPLAHLRSMRPVKPAAIKKAVRQTFAPKKTVKKRPPLRGAGGTAFRAR